MIANHMYHQTKIWEEKQLIKKYISGLKYSWLKIYIWIEVLYVILSFKYIFKILLFETH